MIFCPHPTWLCTAEGVERCIEDSKFATRMGNVARKLDLSILDLEKINQHERSENVLLMAKSFTK